MDIIIGQYVHPVEEAGIGKSEWKEGRLLF